MLLQHPRAFANLLQGFDLAVLCGAVALGLWRAQPPAEPSWWLWLDGLAAVATWAFLADRVRLYQSRRTTGALRELAVLLGVLVASVGVVLLVHAASGRVFAFHVPWAIASAVVAMGGTRVLLRTVLRAFRRRGFNTRNVLFIGRGPSAGAIISEYLDHPGYGIHIVGQLSFSGEERLPTIAGVTQLGGVSELQAVLKVHAIDEVLICPSDGVWNAEVKSVLRFCEAVGLNCRVTPDFLGIPLGRTSLSPTGQVPSYYVRAGFSDTRWVGMKRAIDIVGAGLGLILLSPVLALIALLVKVTSPGPVLFEQTRIGLSGRPFRMLKFRSMVDDAEQLQQELMERNEQTGPVFKMSEDPRVTPLGRWLRKYSLDELPQLWNVLRGEMSLVGPRPPLPEEVAAYDWWQRRRLSVRPGLTCTWQVSGRHAVGFDQWMELDLEYIDGWSLGLDLKIMAKTVKEVLRGGGT